MHLRIYSKSIKINTIISISGLFIFFLLMVLQNLIKAYFGSEYLFVGYFLGAVLLAYFFILDFIENGNVQIYDLDKFLIFFIIIQLIWMIPTIFNSPGAAILGFLYNVRNFFIPYALIRFSLIGSFNKKWLIRWMAFLIFLVACYAIYQYFFDWERFLGISASISGYFYSQGKRAYSFLLTPLDVAYSSMVFGLMMFSYLIEKNRVFGWLARIFLFIVFVVSLLLTFTRSAYLGFAAGFLAITVLFFIKIKINLKIILLISTGTLALAVLILWQFPEFFAKIIRIQDSSAKFHLKNFVEGINIFIGNPMGMGVGTVGWTIVKWGAGEGLFFESAFLQILVESGIIGTVAMILILFKVVLIAISNYLKTGNPLFLGIFGATIGIFIGSFFLPVYYFSNVMSFYWGLVAISFFYIEEASKKQGMGNI